MTVVLYSELPLVMINEMYFDIDLYEVLCFVTNAYFIVVTIL